LKLEARILASRCEGRVCAGYVLRYPGVDGFSLGLEGCTALCKGLREQGYLYEARFYVGDCSCGLPPLPHHAAPPQLRELAEAYLRLAASVASSLGEALPGCVGGAQVKRRGGGE